MRKAIGAGLLSAFVAIPAWADSNIGMTEYPGPSCTKPQVPAAPEAPVALPVTRAGANAAYDPDEVSTYNDKVRQYNEATAAYNKAVQLFNACMETYIDNGNADMQLIKDRLDRAVIDEQAK